MKLNNKGFAISSVLYGILILFIVLTGSYLAVLSAKKNRLDNITKDIENKEGFGTPIDANETLPYTAPYTGKYIFNNDETCFAYISKGTKIENTIILASGTCTPNKITKIYYGGE